MRRKTIAIITTCIVAGATIIAAIINGDNGRTIINGDVIIGIGNRGRENNKYVAPTQIPTNKLAPIIMPTSEPTKEPQRTSTNTPEPTQLPSSIMSYLI